jgi:hypothetical protein
VKRGHLKENPLAEIEIPRREKPRWTPKTGQLWTPENRPVR